MIGCFACDALFAFSRADALFFGDADAPRSREDVIRGFQVHVEAMLVRGHRLHAVVRHALGLFAGEPGTRAWKRALGAAATRAGAGPEALDEALAAAREAAQREPRGVAVGGLDVAGGSA